MDGAPTYTLVVSIADGRVVRTSEELQAVWGTGACLREQRTGTRTSLTCACPVPFFAAANCDASASDLLTQILKQASSESAGECS